MARVARRISKTGLYHIVFRGISRQNIFEESQDYEKMLKKSRKLKMNLNIIYMPIVL
ncbi:MAG: hypothetical protein HPY74_13780 [Firmicutes bacterium]|nr:hypothetical protein [Bacillota bacterium]